MRLAVSLAIGGALFTSGTAAQSSSSSSSSELEYTYSQLFASLPSCSVSNVHGTGGQKQNKKG